MHCQNQNHLILLSFTVIDFHEFVVLDLADEGPRRSNGFGHSGCFVARAFISCPISDCTPHGIARGTGGVWTASRPSLFRLWEVERR
eukprot:m.48420 g.48420  ORF g.48420 m.48420 type:complete len:87 (-) comp8914_c0_seq1:5201-5461(-)